MSKKREKEIFLDAIDLESIEQQHAFVQRECGDDEQLRQAVEALLASHEKSSEVLDDDATPHEQLHQHVQRAAAVFGLPGSRFQRTLDDSFDRTGETVLGYRLMEKLGEGGFGQVYVAQQQHPIRRSVAIKLLKPGMDSKEVLARFDAERQALAMMSHPNIAQVFDAGATPQGQPFIVMELVRGVPITTFCRTKRLAIEQRLALFGDVCRAVHHAHQKGVIHRDLKPSNVLVSLHDATPVVKVIDFGVAKALNEPLTNHTIYTRFAQLIGTPMYMSPEQAEMNAFDVDTRSDIYSLGVLLYELLTDITPFDQHRMQTASFDEMRKMIREEEPPRPSVRLTTVKLSDTKAQRDADTSARELAGRLRGDLDWVVMKALEKERRRRYDTAADLSRDIERYLSDQPVLARPPSPWYRFTKYASRNKLALSAAALVLLSLIVGTAVSTSQAIRATRAQQEAERLRQEAVDFAQRLKDANILLVSARANADQGRLPQAYEQYTKATELTPNHFLTWAGRGSLLARLGAWDTATGDYVKAIKLGPPTNDPSWWGVPHLCYYSGELEAYETLCQALDEMSRHGDDAAQVTVAVRSICLQPIGAERANDLAERVQPWLDSAREPHRFRGPPRDRPPRRNGPRLGEGPPPGNGPPPPRAGFPPDGHRFGLPRELVAYAAGLAEFRSGNDQRAREILEPIADRNGRSMETAVQLSEPVLAMVYHRLGDADKSHEMLERALESYRKLPDRMDSLETPIPWFDEIETVLLLAEANALILSESLVTQPLTQTETHALELVNPQAE